MNTFELDSKYVAQTYRRFPVEIVAGKGAVAFDANGKKYIDMGSGIGVTAFGTGDEIWLSAVTEQLNRGENAVGVLLGNGFYNIADRKRYRKLQIGFGPETLNLKLHLRYEDGSEEVVASDKTWRYDLSPITFNTIYGGEDYDARLEQKGWNTASFDDSDWREVVVQEAPRGELVPQQAPPVKIMRRYGIKEWHKLTPEEVEKATVKTKRTVDESAIFLDMGQNMVGWIKMKVKGAENHTITLRFAETLQKNGELYMENLRDAKVTDTYICNGKENGAWWRPTFVYHGFRYVEIKGYENPKIEDFIGEVVSDEMEVIGSFESSDKVLNQVYRNAYWGILGNYKGLPVDCPQRNERQPWLGDRTMGSLGESYIFENGQLYAKWMRDICEAQREDGCIPDVAPAYWNYYSDNMTWPAALPMSMEMLYTQFGNLKPIELWYPNVKRWLKHMRDDYMTDDYIITKDRYGDWCMPPEREDLIHSEDSPRKTDGAILATTVFYDILRMMTEMAQFTGDDADANHYTRTAMQLKANYNRKFFRADKGYYGNNTVTANILSLQLGLVPDGYEDEVMQHIVEVTENKFHSHVSCGVLGIQHLMRGLTRNGQLDLAWKMVNQCTYPSYGYMIDHGATTIWELWNGNTANAAMNSANHVMLLGDLLLWLFEDLAGISSAEGFNGYAKLEMEPCFPKGLNHVKATQMTASGKVESEWTRQADQLQLRLRIPTNTIARITLPTAFGIMPVVGNGVHSVRQEGFNTIIQVGSGRYEWQTEY